MLLVLLVMLLVLVLLVVGDVAGVGIVGIVGIVGDVGDVGDIGIVGGGDDVGGVGDVASTTGNKINRARWGVESIRTCILILFFCMADYTMTDLTLRLADSPQHHDFVHGSSTGFQIVQWGLGKWHHCSSLFTVVTNDSV